MSLMREDECNWILSGREPLPDDLNGLCDGDDDSDADDNTLDDISGDEVKRNSIEKYVFKMQIVSIFGPIILVRQSMVIDLKIQTNMKISALVTLALKITVWHF